MPDINMQVFEEAKRNQLVTEIDIQTQVALDDYQIQLSDIANPTQSQDNVVIDRHGEFLPHWNESLDFDTWIKMSMEVAGKRILMLRGNSSVSSVSNGDDVFDFFDGCETYDTGKWVSNGTPTSDGDILTIPSGKKITSLSAFASDKIIELNAKYASNLYGLLGFGLNSNADYFAGFYSNYPTGNSHSAVTRINSTPVQTVTNIGVQTNAYHKYKISRIDTTSIKYQIDNGTVYTHTTNLVTGNLESYVYAQSQAITIDNIFIHEYTATEPTWVVDGAEQNIAVALKSLGRAG